MLEGFSIHNINVQGGVNWCSFRSVSLRFTERKLVVTSVSVKSECRQMEDLSTRVGEMS